MPGPSSRPKPQDAGAIEVFIFRGGRFLGSQVFPSSRVVSVGSAPDAALHLDDPEVSPRHAVLYVDAGRLLIAAHGPNRSILVNGTPIELQEISGIDEIAIGGHRLKVDLISTAVPAPAPGSASRVARPAEPPARATAAPVTDDLQLADEVTAPAGSARVEESTTPIDVKSAFDAAVEDWGGDTKRLPVPSPRGSVRPPTSAAPAPAAPSISRPVTAATPAASRPLTAASSGASRPQPAASPAPSSSRPQTAASPAPSSSVRPKTMASPVPSTAPPASRQERPIPTAPMTSAAVSRAQPPAAPAPLPSPAAAPMPDAPLPAGAAHADDEDEDDDRDFVPPFSLLENIVQERFRTPIKSTPQAGIEIVCYKEHRLLDLALIDRGRSFFAFDSEAGKRVELVRLQKNGKALVYFLADTAGNVAIGGKTTSLRTLATDTHLIDAKHRRFAAELGEGDFAHLRLGRDGYLMRFVRPPAPPAWSLDMRMGRADRGYLGFAFLTMIFILIGIWVQSMLAPQQLLAMEEPVEFAEVKLKDLDLEKVEPKKPEPVPEPEPTPPADTVAPAPPEATEPPPKPRKAERREKTRSHRRGQGGVAQEEAPNEAAANAMAALSALPSVDRSISQAVSNIAATRVPTGASKNFQVSPAIGKLPSGEVQLATSGGPGARDTRSATALLQGKEVGKLSGSGGSGKVRGVVDRVPARAVTTTGGSLSRAAIMEVVNAGIRDVQACYERQLIHNPTLHGKLVMDWVIDLSGAVESTRVRSSSLNSQEAATCIAAVIKGWHFQKPMHGSVKVTFPFVFSIQGF